MKDDPPKQRFKIWPVVILLFIPLSALAPWDRHDSNPVLIQDNSLIAQTSCQTHFQVLGTLTPEKSPSEGLFEGILYRTLIKCLGLHESENGVRRSGDQRQSRGYLHYYRWWESNSLWGEKCVGEYGFTDIDDDRQQVLCADMLLQEDFGNVYKWYYSAKKCGK